jgi:hypothetical protein
MLRLVGFGNVLVSGSLVDILVEYRRQNDTSTSHLVILRISHSRLVRIAVQQ